MQTNKIKPTDNRLISSLPAGIRSQFLTQCIPVHLHANATPGGDDIGSSFTYFPLDGIVCLRILLVASKSLDVAMIGNEGMYGKPSWQAGKTTLIDGFVHQSGHFLRMESVKFEQQLDKYPELRLTIGQCVEVLLEQMALTAACVCFHDVRSRLATLLLMTQDRIQCNEMQLTHHRLANSLGVRRSAVSIAASVLQKQNLIHYARGKIRLVSRSGMELVACKCYRELAIRVPH